MSKIEKFEDLEVWKEARQLNKDIYSITKLEPFSKDFDLIRQIRRSSGSVMDNIAEGFERDGKREFIQFLSISIGSCGEVRSQLYRALDQNYILKDTFDNIANQAIKISKKLFNFMNYLRKSDIKGTKFKD